MSIPRLEHQRAQGLFQSDRNLLCRPCNASKGRQKGGEGDRKAGDRAGERSPSPLPSSQPILEIPSSSKPSRPLERSAYRRRTPDWEAVKQHKTDARKEREARAAKVAKFSQSIRTDTTAHSFLPSLLFVDGYNVLFRDAQLTKVFQFNPILGRAELEKWVEAYARVARIRCMMVWDAMQGPSQRTTHTTASDSWVTCVYSGACEADTLIVAKAQQALRKGVYKVVVVSADRRIQMELTDEDSIMLDTDQFMQHLREVQAGNISGPESWRSLWRRPRLTPYNPEQQEANRATQLLASGAHGQSDGSDSEDVSEGQATMQELVGSDELVSALELIVQKEQRRQQGEGLYSGRGATYMQALLSSSNATPSEGENEPLTPSDDNEDDDDLDALLRRKF